MIRKVLALLVVVVSSFALAATAFARSEATPTLVGIGVWHLRSVTKGTRRVGRR